MTGRYRYATDHHGQKLIVAREGLLWFFCNGQIMKLDRHRL
jgi:hypothetical protein